jgi:hypothetical protein
MQDRDESIHRRMNALNASELIRTEGLIIKGIISTFSDCRARIYMYTLARLVKRNCARKLLSRTPSTWENITYAARVASAVGEHAFLSAMEAAAPSAEKAANGV